MWEMDVFLEKILRCCSIFLTIFKGQLISKCFLCVFNLSQKMNKNKSTWGIIFSSKVEFFVWYLGELRITKSIFEVNWPLVARNKKNFSTMGCVPCLFSHFFLYFFEAYIVDFIETMLLTNWICHFPLKHSVQNTFLFFLCLYLILLTEIKVCIQMHLPL